MRTTDGGIWRLCWEKTPKGYRGWVETRPRVAATGATFAQMEKRLCEEVSSQIQAGEWTADWVPPRPVVAGKAGAEPRGQALASHVALSYDGRIVCLQDPRQLFESWCDTCGSPTGPRTKARLRMFVESPANLCGDFGTAPGSITVMSEELAAALAPMTGRDVEFRPCERFGKGNREYVEPVIRKPDRLPRPVALRTKEKLGWKCDRCGYRYLYHDWNQYPATTMHRRSELPVKTDLFWVGNCWGLHDVCVRAEWWKAHRRAKWAGGVLSETIGVASDAEIDGRPRLDKREVPSKERGGKRALWLKKQISMAERRGLAFEAWTL